MSAGLTPAARPQALAIGLVMAITMNAFESMAVVTAMPAVAADLRGDRLYGAAFSAYMLANLVSLVATGEQADRHGPARPFLAGVVALAAGLVVAALAPTMAFVVLGRVLQGAGAGALASVSYVAIARVFPAERQPRLFAMLAAAWVVPSLLAPALAGVITEEVGWRWVFAGLLPLLPVLVVLAYPSLRTLSAPKTDAAADPTARRLPIALLLAAGTGLAVGGLQSGRWWVAVPLTTVGIALAAPAVRRLFPVGTFRARAGLPAAVASRLCVNVAFFGTDIFVPLAANRIHGVGTLAAGLVITGASLTWSTGAAISARQSERRSPDRVVRFGFAIVAIGVAATAPVVFGSTPLWVTFACWTVAGLGVGLVFNTTSVSAMAGAPVGREGLVSSQLQTADTLGFAMVGGVGGALVGLADRGTFSLSTALLVEFAIAATVAVVGMAAAGGVRRAAREPIAPVVRI